MKHLYYLKSILLLLAMLGVYASSSAQNAVITVDASQGKKKISPLIYGKNESLDKTAQFYKDAGLRFARIGGGNNMSAYNWKKKMTVHPDWYNNVYDEDWDKYAQIVNNDFTDLQAMFAFQLLGRVANSKDHNFNDWGYNRSAWWWGVNENLAGGGTVNPDNVEGVKALKDGDITLFSKEWPADSALAILNHWFDKDGLALDKSKFMYWDMDNEPEIWCGTHDWAMPTQIAASAFMDRFFEYAKKAKAIFPDIKICGPVAANEWQWYKYASEDIRVDGKYYCWLEYFIKRCAEEEKSSGIRVLDEVDIHSYPDIKNGDAEALQLHRLYYDTSYEHPCSNGLHTINGGYDTSLNKEYIFKRISDWIDKYYGANSGIDIGLGEWTPNTTATNSSATAVVYASHLGTFANHGVNTFTSWSWQTGMWETLHLFSRYAKDYSISSTSSIENTVSAYSSINNAADSMTVIIVNRDMSAARNVTVNLNNFGVGNGNYTTLQLASLPSTETFVSHTNNALKTSTVTVTSNSFTLTVPSLSVTAVILKSATTDISAASMMDNQESVVAVYNQSGQKVSTDMSTLGNGVYMILFNNGKGLSCKKVMIQK
jgi:hypothetical protein